MTWNPCLHLWDTRGLFLLFTDFCVLTYAFNTFTYICLLKTSVCVFQYVLKVFGFHNTYIYRYRMHFLSLLLHDTHSNYNNRRLIQPYRRLKFDTVWETCRKAVLLEMRVHGISKKRCTPKPIVYMFAPWCSACSLSAEDPLPLQRAKITAEAEQRKHEKLSAAAFAEREKAAAATKEAQVSLLFAFPRINWSSSSNGRAVAFDTNRLHICFR